jgi:hypothetical protein
MSFRINPFYFDQCTYRVPKRNGKIDKPALTKAKAIPA